MMKRRMLQVATRVVVIVVLCSGVSTGKGSQVRSRRVKVVVVEVAGGRAYLSTRGRAPLAAGDKVTIRGRGYLVVASNAKNAVVPLKGSWLKRGQRGVAVRATREKAPSAQRYTTPAPLKTYAGLWPAIEPPALSQTPAYVPLGVTTERRSSYAMLLADYALIAPLSGRNSPIGRTRLRARLHWELQHAPLTVDADGYLELWHAADLAARRANASRPLLNLRQLELGYRGEALSAAGGRLRYASRNAGMLDGMRLSAPVSDSWSIAAFGGVLPDVRRAKLQTEASRFGAEATYQSQSRSQTRGTVAFQGSRYNGSLDERRLLGSLASFPTFGRIGVRAEVNWFDSDNPWGADSTELTALAGDLSFKLNEQLRFNAAVAFRRPERTRWLAAALPPGFFCAAEPQVGTGLNAPCAGGDRRLSANGTLVWSQRDFVVSSGAAGARTQGAKPEQYSAFVNLRALEIVRQGALDAGLSASTGTSMERVALNLGADTRLFTDEVDASVYYRPVLARYRAGLGTFVEHAVGARFFWSVSEQWDLNFSADTTQGADVSFLTLHGGFAWRPRF